MSDEAERNAELLRSKDTSATGTKKTFTGSCACGKITYKADLALPDEPFITKCNCSLCQKRGWFTLKMDKADFHLLTPCTSEQAWNSKHGEYFGIWAKDTSRDMKRCFCDVCGSSFAMQGFFEYEGREIHFFAIDPKSLDQPQEGLEMSEFKVKYHNMLADEMAPPRPDRPHPGGLI
ncbi:hypothetical protein ANO11243_088830 [Dothideomycetidae sp. 11243]|nr:hypothetical protein ANO11243_088830 [fungal sp. No.11243]